MCWYGKNNPRIATEDIKVFKIFKYSCDNKIFSPIMPMKWKKGELAPRRIFPDFEDNFIIIRVGYHSCRDLKIQKYDYLTYPYYEGIRGHFVSPIDETQIMSQKDNFIMLTCIIPKGTKYYENDRGEIVSETIKIL